MLFEYKINPHENCNIVFLKGKLINEFDAIKLKDECAHLINESKINFIFNLKALQYFNSAGLNALIHILTLSRNKEGEIILCEIPQNINELLVVTKLNAVFTVTASQNEAEENLKVSAPYK